MRKTFVTLTLIFVFQKWIRCTQTNQHIPENRLFLDWRGVSSMVGDSHSRGGESRALPLQYSIFAYVEII